MTEVFTFFATSEGIVTLIFVAAVGVAYWICAMLKNGTCKLDGFAFLLLSAVGIVTGVYIFGGSLKRATGSSQEIIWGGITGFILTLYSLEQVIRSFRQQLARQVAP